jgi:hypothetical protein
MLLVTGGVEFCLPAEDRWSGLSCNAGRVGDHSLSTAGAFEATSTVARAVGAKAVSEQRAQHVGTTASRLARMTARTGATPSEPGERGVPQWAWGIKLPVI